MLALSPRDGWDWWLLCQGQRLEESLTVFVGAVDSVDRSYGLLELY